MPSSTPDWSALGSEHERLAGGPAGEGPPAPAARRPWWRGRAARGAAAGTAAVLAVAGAASASAAATTTAAPTTAAPTTAAPTAGSASWHIVKRVHSGSNGGFTAITAAGKTGGWAFNGYFSPTAWKRSGSTWKKASFPGKAGETVVAAGATSAANVWAFTGDGGPSVALRWNGRHWATVRTFPHPIGGAAVLSASDVWVFGAPGPGALGSWHYNGRSWSHVASGHGLQGGSGTSSAGVWAFGGTHVAHWNGRTWRRTSVKKLLPALSSGGLNNPAVTGIDAQSRDSVYAVGNGNAQDEGGPLVVLHYNGHAWRRVAEASEGPGTFPVQQVSSDGHGGLWIPMPGGGGQQSFLLHYSGGHLTRAALPASASEINVETVALIPGSTHVLSGGFTHGSDNPGIDVVAVILQYGG